jgi:hypothetical protein
MCLPSGDQAGARSILYMKYFCPQIGHAKKMRLPQATAATYSCFLL